MSLFRRIQTPVVAILLVLLAAPAAAMCCAWTPAAAACCTDNQEARLVSACCVESAGQSPDRPMPSVTAKSSRSDVAPAALAAALPSVLSSAAFPAPPLDGFAAPPASERLYLRLSVIRR
jgi:hypothetical protein